MTFLVSSILQSPRCILHKITTRVVSLIPWAQAPLIEPSTFFSDEAWRWDDVLAEGSFLLILGVWTSAGRGFAFLPGGRGNFSWRLEPRGSPEEQKPTREGEILGGGEGGTQHPVEMETDVETRTMYSRRKQESSGFELVKPCAPSLNM